MSFTGGVPLNAILTWGANNVSNTVDTRVVPPGYTQQTINANTPKGWRSPRAGVLRNFTARHNTANGNGNSVVYAIRKNGVVSALSVTLATGAVGSGISTNQLTVAAGDLIECVRTIAVAIGNGEQEAICACEFMGASNPGVL